MFHDARRVPKSSCPCRFGRGAALSPDIMLRYYRLKIKTKVKGNQVFYHAAGYV